MVKRNVSTNTCICGDKADFVTIYIRWLLQVLIVQLLIIYSIRYVSACGIEVWAMKHIHRWWKLVPLRTFYSTYHCEGSSTRWLQCIFESMLAQDCWIGCFNFIKEVWLHWLYIDTLRRQWFQGVYFGIIDYLYKTTNKPAGPDYLTDNCGKQPPGHQNKSCHGNFDDSRWLPHGCLFSG